jgi:N-methylhydantoinase B
LGGGHDGTPSDVLLNPGSVNEERLPTKFTRRIRHDDVVRVVVAGGGGYGDPSERDPDAVSRDVADGKLTAACATSVYGRASDEELAWRP